MKHFGKKLIIFCIILFGAVTLTACKDSVTVTEISVNSISHKTQYYIGDVISVENLTILVTKSDGKEETIAVKPSWITLFDSDTVGKQTLLITYKEKTATFDITVEPLELISISVNSSIHKTQYFIGEELCVKNLTIELVFNSGSKAIKQVEEDWVAGFDGSSISTKSLTIFYQGHQASYDISVFGIEPVEFVVSSKTHITDFYIGEEFSAENLTLQVTYNNGDKNTVPVQKEWVSGFDSSEKTDNLMLTIMYDGELINYCIRIIDKHPTSIEILENGYQNLYCVNYNIEMEKFELIEGYAGDIFIKLYYENNRTGIIKVATELTNFVLVMESALAEFNNNSVAFTVKTVIVDYKGAIAEFDVCFADVGLTCNKITGDFKIEYEINEPFQVKAIQVNRAFECLEDGNIYKSKPILNISNYYFSQSFQGGKINSWEASGVVSLYIVNEDLKDLDENLCKVTFLIGESLERYIFQSVTKDFSLLRESIKRDYDDKNQIYENLLDGLSDYITDLSCLSLDELKAQVKNIITDVNKEYWSAVASNDEALIDYYGSLFALLEYELNTLLITFEDLDLFRNSLEGDNSELNARLKAEGIYILPLELSDINLILSTIIETAFEDGIDFYCSIQDAVQNATDIEDFKNLFYNFYIEKELENFIEGNDLGGSQMFESQLAMLKGIYADSYIAFYYNNDYSPELANERYLMVTRTKDGLQVTPVENFTDVNFDCGIIFHEDTLLFFSVEYIAVRYVKN